MDVKERIQLAVAAMASMPGMRCLAAEVWTIQGNWPAAYKWGGDFRIIVRCEVGLMLEVGPGAELRLFGKDN